MIAQLAPFIDDKGIIRVDGRLKRALLDEDAKHPILLPQKTHLTELIIRNYHHISLHGGSRSVLAMIHQKFWIISVEQPSVTLPFHVFLALSSGV